MDKPQSYFWILVVFSSVLLAGFCISRYLGSSFYSAGAIITSATIALTAAMIGVKYQRQTARESNTLSFQDSLASDSKYSDSLNLVKKAIRERGKLKIEHYADDTYKAYGHKQSDEVSAAIRYVLNKWERAALAMQHRIFDEEFLYKAHKSMILDLGIYFRMYISKLQQSNASYYCNFNWLVLKWSIRRDSYQENETKKKLIIVWKELDKIQHGKIHAKDK
ncbi:DUF4760 domain-containing protein [Agarivorans sp. DSG3-1]|uniref:DUF4760 domain-containing protein n=1 Tax=Agarivorans sp. DSG3-1 TaxID=3342249 RepID=UPI00398E65E3